MTVFVVAAALILIVALILLLRPYLLLRQGKLVSHRLLNSAIYRDQLAKLDQDKAEGTLAATDYDEARNELQRRMLAEVTSDESMPPLARPRWTIAALAIVVPVFAIGFYLVVGQPVAIDAPAKQASAAAPDVEKMVDAFAAKMANDPGNLKGWAMLGRSYKVLGRTLEAEQAFARAGNFIDNDAQMLADYADAAATDAQGNFAGKPAMLAEKALQVDPENALALWLAGNAAFQFHDFDTAVADWEKLKAKIPANSDDARELQTAIDEAKSKGGKAIAATSPANTNRAAGADKAVAAGSARVVTGTVDVDAALQSKVAQGDTVMIIARPVGARIPVAVLRARASELPLAFTLDDSTSIDPHAPISGLSEVTIEARVSKSSMAQPQPGDLISAVKTVKVGAHNITLHVAQIRP